MAASAALVEHLYRLVFEDELVSLVVNSTEVADSDRSPSEKSSGLGKRLLRQISTKIPFSFMKSFFDLYRRKKGETFETLRERTKTKLLF